MPKLRMILEFAPLGDLYHGFHFNDQKIQLEKSQLKEDRAKKNIALQSFLGKVKHISSIEREKYEKIFQNLENEFTKREKDLNERQIKLDKIHRLLYFY